MVGIAVRAVTNSSGRVVAVEMLSQPVETSFSNELLERADERFLSVADDIVTITHTKGRTRYQLGPVDDQGRCRPGTRVDD